MVQTPFGKPIVEHEDKKPEISKPTIPKPEFHKPVTHDPNFVASGVTPKTEWKLDPNKPENSTQQKPNVPPVKEVIPPQKPYPRPFTEDHPNKATAIVEREKEHMAAEGIELPKHSSKPIPKAVAKVRKEFNSERAKILKEYGGLESNIPINHAYWTMRH